MEERIIKYFLGKLRNYESSQLFKELQNNKNLRKEFIQLQNSIALANLSKDSINDSEGRKKYEQFLHKLKIKKLKKITVNTVKYTAIGVFLIVSTIFTTLYFQQNNTNSEFNCLSVPAGQRAHLTLHDGTSVWLNAQSTLIYPTSFSGKTRNVTLTGEAYFDVAENAKKPFVVSTQNIELKVLGTKFNVYSYPEVECIKTDLVEGSLMVIKNGFPQESLTMKPKQQLLVMEGNMYIRNIQSSDYFLWKEGIYTFENEKLLDIVNKLELYYDVKIELKDPELFNIRYTGKFRQRDGIDEILRIIQKIHKFNIQKDIEKNKITITK